MFLQKKNSERGQSHCWARFSRKKILRGTTLQLRDNAPDGGPPYHIGHHTLHRPNLLPLHCHTASYAILIPRSTISTPPVGATKLRLPPPCKPGRYHGIIRMWYCATKEKLMTECIPARLTNGEIAEGSNARRVCRRVLTKRDGPRPTPKHVCRHL